MSQADLDNRSNQKNPNHWRYWKARGYDSRPDNWRDLIPEHEYDSDDSNSRNNRANQLNPNHISYWKSRGYSTRPLNWRRVIGADEYISEEMESQLADSSASTALALIGGGLAMAVIARIFGANRR